MDRRLVERQEAREKKRETRSERQETRSKRQEPRKKRLETRILKKNKWIKPVGISVPDRLFFNGGVIIFL